MKVLGIDPGVYGAFVVIDTQAHRVIAYEDMADTPMQSVERLCDLVETCSPVVAMIEEPLAIPGTSVRTVAKTHINYGVILGALAVLEVSTDTVRPSVWKHRMGLTRPRLSMKDRKNLSRQTAARRFPGNAALFARVKDDGRAEAALLALYGAPTVHSP